MERYGPIRLQSHFECGAFNRSATSPRRSIPPFPRYIRRNVLRTNSSLGPFLDQTDPTQLERAGRSGPQRLRQGEITPARARADKRRRNQPQAPRASCTPPVPVRESCGTALRSVLGTPRWSPHASVSTPPRNAEAATAPTGEREEIQRVIWGTRSDHRLVTTDLQPSG